ncbi:MAG: YggU family protein [Gammaproteobacteria bacterium]|nr:YggU family protein [Gammaproteobacteria bacterium]
MGAFYRWQGEDLILFVRLQPRASRNEIIAEQNGRLKLRLTAPPVEGKVNIALRKFLAKTFGVANQQVTLETGDSHRDKRLRIRAPTCLVAGITRQTLKNILKFHIVATDIENRPEFFPVRVYK